MSNHTSPEFDVFAANYDEALNRGLKFSGERKEYFADGRVHWLRRCLGHRRIGGGVCLDFGCGVGIASPYLMRHLNLKALTGTDVSEQSLHIARATFGHSRVSFVPNSELEHMESHFDLAYCNGVFHHIPLAERAANAKVIFNAMKPGGYFAFWENNKWNPMVHYIMSRVPFDADAMMLWPHVARRLLRAAGFEVVRTDYLFIFPGVLAKLRFMEPWLCKLPLGGQYQILCRRSL